jgi:hypothetical protein
MPVMNANNDSPLERWLRPLPFGLFLALALFACYPQVLIGMESFFTRDYGVLGYPNIHFQRECFARGELPMWNPYSNCGQPFLAQWGTMALYPFSLIYLLLPLPWSLSLFCFLHVWLGGMGMHALAKHWTQTNSAGALAGTTYVFSGVMFASFIWPNYLVTLGWMPWVVLLAERAWREGGRWLVGASLVSGLQMLSGAPEVILFTWFITGALWLCDAARAPGSVVPLLKRLLCVIGLTAGLAAAQLVPFFDLLQMAHRETSFGTAKWQLPLWGWANFLVPLYNAFQAPSGQFYQYDQGFLSSVFLGGVAVTFALVGVFRWPDLRVQVLLVLAALSVVMAFGDQTPVFRAIRDAVPLVGLARYPVKFLFVLAFVMPLLAGCGMAAVAKSRLNTGVFLAGFLLLTIMVAVGWAVHGQRFADYSGWPRNFRDNLAFTWRETSSGSFRPDGQMNLAVRCALFIAALVMLAKSITAKRLGPVLAFGALGLIAADVRLHSPGQNPTLSKAMFTKHYWAEDSSKLRPGEPRVLITPEAEAFLSFLSITNAEQLWEFKRRAEWSNLNLLDGVAKVNGSSTLQIKEQRQIEQTLYSMTNRLPAGLLDFLGVSFVTSSNGASEWSRRTTALPLVTAGQAPVFVEDEKILAALTNNSFNPRQTVLLPTSIRRVITVSNAALATLGATTFANASILVDVDTPAPALVMIAQSYDPKWKATVDGETVPLLRANHAFQALQVPTGKHRVQLVYTDSKFLAGIGVSGASLLLCLLIWLRMGPAHRE